jgi:hypothetical protein
MRPDIEEMSLATRCYALGRVRRAAQWTLKVWQYSRCAGARSRLPALGRSRSWLCRFGAIGVYNWAIHSQLDLVRRVALVVRCYLDGILNSVVLGATNARSRSENAKIP